MKCTNPLCRYFYCMGMNKPKPGLRLGPKDGCLFPDYVTIKQIDNRDGCENHRIDLLWSYFNSR